MDYIAEAALRSLALAALVRLSIAGLRITHPQQEKLVWILVLAGALAMPALMHWPLLPAIPIASASAATVAIRGLRLGSPSPQHVNYVLAVYTAVSALLLLRMAIAAGRMWRIRAAARPVREPWAVGLDVRVAPELSSPATFGVTILVPPDHLSWSEAKRSIILQHEATHVRHYDSQIQWLAGLHACVFWFSPLAWWLRHRLAQLAEFSSDDAVLSRNVSNVDYATILLEEARRAFTRPMLISIASRGLEQRVERILARTQPDRLPSRTRGTFALLSVLPLVTLAAQGTGQEVPVGSERHDRSRVDSAPAEITSAPSPEDMEKYYPREAQAKGINGLVRITVTVDTAGRATDTHVLWEKPAGLGFGAAASELAHQFRYANPASHPSPVTYKIKFELRH